MDPSQFQIIISALKVIQGEGYSKAATLTFLLCDISSTFYDEVKCIWSAKWTFPKLLYILIRYYPVLIVIAMIIAGERQNPTVDYCWSYIRVMAMVGNRVVMLVIDIICIIRVHALYNRSPKILAFIVICSCIDSGVGFYAVYRITHHSASELRPPQSPLSSRYGCGFLQIPMTDDMTKAFIVNALLGFANAANFFLLTIFRLKVSLADETGVVKIHLMKYKSPLLAAFVRDGALGFLMLATMQGVSAFMCLYRRAFYFPPYWPWIFGVSCYVGSRLLLNLRIAGRRNMQMLAGGETTGLPPLRFASHQETNAFSMSEIPQSRADHV